jgi:APA family basic amino acid/polyamine antiporter
MKYAAMPSWMVWVVALGSVIAHTAVLLVFQLGQPRIFFAMSRDGLLWPFFSKVHPRFKTPHIGTIITGVFVGTAALFSSLEDAVDFTNIGTLFAFMLVCIGITVLRYKEPNRERPFRVPGGPWLVPMLGAASCLVLASQLPHRSWWRFGIWLVIGLVLYFFYGFVHSRLRTGRRGGPRPPDFNPEQQLPQIDVEK